MTPPAVRAVVAAAVEDAQRDGEHDPESVAVRVLDELAARGWTLTPDQTPHGPHTAAQPLITAA